MEEKTLGRFLKTKSVGLWITMGIVELILLGICAFSVFVFFWPEGEGLIQIAAGILLLMVLTAAVATVALGVILPYRSWKKGPQPQPVTCHPCNVLTQKVAQRNWTKHYSDQMTCFLCFGGVMLFPIQTLILIVSDFALYSLLLLGPIALLLYALAIRAGYKLKHIPAVRILEDTVSAVGMEEKEYDDDGSTRTVTVRAVYFEKHGKFDGNSFLASCYTDKLNISDAVYLVLTPKKEILDVFLKEEWTPDPSVHIHG